MKMNSGIVKSLVLCLVSSSLTACGSSQSLQTVKGDPGATGLQGFGAGVLAESITGLCGVVDGVRITTFQDKNNDGIREVDEPITAVTSVCNGLKGVAGVAGSNGLNGVNGTSSTISISTVAAACGLAGGYTLTTTNGVVSSSYPICNGAKGIQGAPGLQGIPGTNGVNGHDGVNGTNGLNGANGSTVTPVKFCNTDHGAFPEYGLYIGGNLFAVYWGSTPASNGQSQAFLAEITPGNYVSTGGNGCAFTILPSGAVQ